MATIYKAWCIFDNGGQFCPDIIMVKGHLNLHFWALIFIIYTKCLFICAYLRLFRQKRYVFFVVNLIVLLILTLVLIKTFDSQFFCMIKCTSNVVFWYKTTVNMSTVFVLALEILWLKNTYLSFSIFSSFLNLVVLVLNRTTSRFCFGSVSNTYWI